MRPFERNVDTRVLVTNAARKYTAKSIESSTRDILKVKYGGIKKKLSADALATASRAMMTGFATRDRQMTAARYTRATDR